MMRQGHDLPPVSDDQGNVIDIVELEVDRAEPQLVLFLQHADTIVSGRAVESVLIPEEAFESEVA